MMWDLLPRQYQLYITVFLTLVFYHTINAINSLCQNWLEHPGFTWIQTLSLITSALGVAGVLIVNFTWRWFWKKLPLCNWLFPDLNGIWVGTVSWSDNKEIKSKPITFTIHQTFFSLRLHSQTNESPSHSTRSVLVADREVKRYKILYSYEADPSAKFLHRSPRHEGMAWLEIDMTKDKHKLVGQYYTQRKTSGSITLKRKGT